MQKSNNFLSVYDKATKVVVNRCKFKKFNYLKHNSQKKRLAIAVDSTEQQRNSYPSAVNSKDVKSALSGLRQFLATESPLKVMKSDFYFTSKELFVLKTFKFLS